MRQKVKTWSAGVSPAARVASPPPAQVAPPDGATAAGGDAGAPLNQLGMVVRKTSQAQWPTPVFFAASTLAR